MKNCPLCNTAPEVDDYAIVTCDNPFCDLWRIAIRREQWNHRPIEQRLAEAARTLCDIASEYSDGCGSCGTHTLDETPEFKQLDAVLQSIIE